MGEISEGDLKTAGLVPLFVHDWAKFEYCRRRRGRFNSWHGMVYPPVLIAVTVPASV
jgi:hypothetical protein